MWKYAIPTSNEGRWIVDEIGDEEIIFCSEEFFKKHLNLKGKIIINIDEWFRDMKINASDISSDNLKNFFDLICRTELNLVSAMEWCRTFLNMSSLKEKKMIVDVREKKFKKYQRLTTTPYQVEAINNILKLDLGPEFEQNYILIKFIYNTLMQYSPRTIANINGEIARLINKKSPQIFLFTVYTRSKQGGFDNLIIKTNKMVLGYSEGVWKCDLANFRMGELDLECVHRLMSTQSLSNIYQYISELVHRNKLLKNRRVYYDNALVESPPMKICRLDNFLSADVLSLKPELISFSEKNCDAFLSERANLAGVKYIRLDTLISKPINVVEKNGELKIEPIILNKYRLVMIDSETKRLVSHSDIMKASSIEYDLKVDLLHILGELYLNGYILDMENNLIAAGIFPFCKYNIYHITSTKFLIFEKCGHIQIANSYDVYNFLLKCEQ